MFKLRIIAAAFSWVVPSAGVVKPHNFAWAFASTTAEVDTAEWHSTLYMCAFRAFTYVEASPTHMKEWHGLTYHSTLLAFTDLPQLLADNIRMLPVAWEMSSLSCGDAQSQA